MSERDISQEIEDFRDWQYKRERFCACGKRAKHTIILSTYSGHYCDDCFRKVQDRKTGIKRRDEEAEA